MPLSYTTFYNVGPISGTYLKTRGKTQFLVLVLLNYCVTLSIAGALATSPTVTTTD